MILMRSNHICKAALFSLACAIAWSGVMLAHAEIRVEMLESVDNSRQDFVVGPGKTELTLNPGESATVELIVTNRTGEERRFNIGIEDIAGSRSVEQVVTLLGNEKGPYSLRDFIKPDSDSFVLKSGQRAWVPVTVTIPTDAEPGGKYGSVIVSTTGVDEQGASDAVAGGTVLVSRIGTLFFVTVPGNAQKNGELKSFELSDGKTLRGQGPIQFNILYENTGRVHLNPSGEIRVRNLFNQEVASIEITPWFSLPNSLRLREVVWDAPFLMGRYTAELELKRGYDGKIDTETVTFYVIPWLLVGAVAVALFVLLLVLRWILSRFEIRRRS